jgi:hypothetical protein
MRTFCIYLILSLWTSCSNDDKSNKERFPNSIHDLLAVSGDTLIGAKWESGIIVTTDGGKTWIEKAHSTSIKEITIDNNGILWGLNSWVGIHESSYSRLMFSKDFGNSWERIEFNVDQFFPTNFFSKPHENLAVATFDNKTYRLTGNDYKKNWTLIDTLDQEADRSTYSLPYKISSSTFLLKQNNNGVWDTLIKIPDISIPFEIIQAKDTLFIAAGGYGGYKALFASVINDTALTKYEMKSIQALGVVQDSKGRIWTFGDGGIFILQKDKLKKMY